MFPGCFQDFSRMFSGWSPGIRWSPAIRWSIRSKDFDKPKVYGDTSITDGLVFNPSYRDCSQCSNACSVSTLVIKDLPALHCSITTKIQQVPMIQIVSTLLKPIRQKYPPAPSPSDADPPKMGHTDGRSHHPRWSIFLRHRSDRW